MIIKIAKLNTYIKYTWQIADYYSLIKYYKEIFNYMLRPIHIKYTINIKFQ